MPLHGPGQRPGGSGGLLLRSPPDIFAGANLAACIAARNTYFAAGANAAALAEFQASQFLAVILDPAGDNNSVWQTYAPGEEGNAHNAGKWLDRTSFARGPAGAPAVARALQVNVADSGGTPEGETLTFESFTDVFTIITPPPTETADRFLLTLPAGTTLRRVADGTGEILEFTRTARGARTWLSDFDFLQPRALTVQIR